MNTKLGNILIIVFDDTLTVLKPPSIPSSTNFARFCIYGVYYEGNMKVFSVLIFWTV